MSWSFNPTLSYPDGNPPLATEQYEELTLTIWVTVTIISINSQLQPYEWPYSNPLTIDSDVIPVHHQAIAPTSNLVY